MKRTDNTSVLKGFAIIAVVAIHVLSSFKTSVFVGYEQKYLTLAVLIDQLSRISVPLFVALSGYGLSQKYAQQKLQVKEFFTHQIGKLLPKYIGWSLLFMALFWLIPSWRSAQAQPAIPIQLLLGRADYHLYFVPMIIQLYVLFPFLRWWYQKIPGVTLVLAFAVQILWWWQFSYQNKAPLSIPLFAQDREQYIWCFNWIGYFVLGFALPMIVTWLNTVKFLPKLLLVSTVGLWLIIGVRAVTQIKSGVDPLIVLRFTQYPLLVYASGGIVSLFYFAHRRKTYPRLLVELGKRSYDIYLSHTLWLRIIFNWLV